MPTHDRFDLNRWRAEFPLSRLRDEAERFVRKRHRDMPHQYADEKAIQDHIQLMSPKRNVVVAQGY